MSNIKKLNKVNSDEPFLAFSLTLIVRGKELDLDLITSKMGLVPTQQYKSNGTVNTEPLDAWYYKLKTNDESELRMMSKRFFQDIGLVGVKLDKMELDYKVILHIQSSMAQVYFDLPPEIIESLYQSHLPFAISILDWGEVE